MNELKYKWIHFTCVHDSGKTKTHNCYNTENGSFLGQVKWYGQWRKYSFFPEPNLVFESQCLRDIYSFLEGLMIERKISKQEKTQ